MTIPAATLLPTSYRRRVHDRAGLTALVLTYSAGLTAWLLLTPGLAPPWHALGVGLAVGHWLALAVALATLPVGGRRDSMWDQLLFVGVLVGLVELAAIAPIAALGIALTGLAYAGVNAAGRS